MLNSDVIEIHDPDIDQEAIRQQLMAQGKERLAAGGYRPDLAGQELGVFPLGQPERADSVLTEFPGLNQALVELVVNAAGPKPPLTSSRPFFGRVIGWLRRGWQRVVNGWYLRSGLWRQSQVNSRLGNAVSDLAEWQSLTTQSVSELQAQVEALQARLAELEKQEKR